MRHAVHQILVHLAAKAVAGGPLLGSGGTALGVVNRNFAVSHLFQQLFGLVDAVIHPGKQHGLAVKAGGLHIFVCSYDDAVTGCDLGAGQHVLSPIGAVGLHLCGQAQLVTGLGQRLGGHVGVGNAVGAGGYGQNAVAALGDGLLGEALLTELGLLLCVDEGKEFGGGLGGL